MKRIALVVLVLTGCPPLEVTKGRYACDPTSNQEVGSAQCPGASRCGLEGFCHDVGDTSVRWKCDDASDCENDWQCGVGVDGVSRECHDPNAPEDFRCVTSADCSGGWTCGLDRSRLRRCHDPMNPRRWPCESVADCVGGWQCGIAATGGGECQDPSRPEAFICVSNADCLGGWKCGLNALRTGRECHDPAAPRAFACEVATDCLASWSCGLNDARTARECHDPAAPRAFACEVATDCLASWSCGLNDARTARECHDPANPRAFACQVPTDCLAGWQCGLAANRLQRECHDPANPQAFACESDADCVAAWRCDTRGLCVNPQNDALLAAGPVDAGEVTTLNPIETTPFDRAAVSPVSPLTSESVLAVTRNNRLEALSLNSGSGAFRSWALGPAGDGPLLVQSPRSLDFNGFRFVEVNANRVYLGQRDGGVMAYLLEADGGFSSRVVRNDGQAFSVNTPVTQLRHGTADRGMMPAMLGFSESPANGFIIFDGPGAALDYSYPSSITSRPNNRIIDLVDVQTRDGGLECVLALDSAGVWARQFMTDNSWNFEQVHTPAFGNDTCAPTGLKVTRLESASPTHVMVQAQPRDGGALQVAVWSLTPMLTRGTGEFDSYCTSINEQSCTPQDAIPFAVELGPCEPCPVGTLAGLSPVPLGTATPELEARCVSADGGVPSFFRIARRALTSTACERRPLVGRSSLFSAPFVKQAEQVSLGRFLFTGPTGQLWTGPSVITATPLSFDRAPTGVASLGANPRDVVVIADELTGVLEQRFGLLAFPGAAITAVAANEPGWVLSGPNLTTLAAGSTLGDAYTFGLLSNLPPQPHLVRRAVASTGAQVAIVSGGGLVFSAEVDQSLSRQVPFALLSSRATAPATLTDLSFPTSAVDAGVWLEGYGVTNAGLIRVSAESSSRWSVRPVPLPPTLTPQATWHEGTRARVGMTDGTVFSLPSSVPIAPRVPGGVVVGYARACQHQLALTPRSLYRLERVVGMTLGRWVELPLPPTFADGDLLGGSLHTVQSDVYVFSRLGDALRLTLTPCTP